MAPRSHIINQSGVNPSSTGGVSPATTAEPPVLTGQDLLRMMADPIFSSQRNGRPRRLIPPWEPQESEGDTLDLREVLGKLWAGRWTVVVTALLTLACAFLLITQIKPQYTATATMMFDTNKAQILDLQQVLADPQFGKDAMQNEVEVLRSTALLERVIDELGLEFDTQFNAALRVPEETVFTRLMGLVTLPPDLTAFLTDIGVFAPDGPPPDPVEAARRERLGVIDEVRKGLELEPLAGSQIIQISFTSANPRTSATIANSISEQYLFDQLDAKLATTRAATEWLSGRVDELQLRVQTAEEAVETHRAELAQVAGQSLQITERQRDAVSATLADERRLLGELDAQYARLLDAMAQSEDLASIREFRNSDIIQAFRRQETALAARHASLVRSTAPGHPLLARIEDELVTLREQIDTEAARIVTAIRLELDTVRTREAALGAELQALERQAFAQSRDEVALRQAEREAEASRLLYQNFLARLKETSEQEALQSADARVLSPAEAPLRPEQQKKNLILALAGVVGACLGIGLVFLMDSLNNTFRTPHELEARAGLNVLSALPTLGPRLDRAKVVRHLVENPRSALAEGIRNLRTSILFSGTALPPRVVMFTSSVPREGKSTTATLLGMSSQQMGKRSIIVDCDLRLPALAKLVGRSDEGPGLMSVLEHKTPWREAVHVDDATGVHMLTVRPSELKGGLNAADILSAPRFRDLIAQLSEDYELVILDTPPTLVVTDARILSSIADAVVYAVRWDKTPRGAVLQGLKELESVQAPITGLVMTMMNEARAEQYAYEGYRYDKGRYRAYYA